MGQNNQIHMLINLYSLFLNWISETSKIRLIVVSFCHHCNQCQREEHLPDAYLPQHLPQHLLDALTKTLSSWASLFQITSQGLPTHQSCTHCTSAEPFNQFLVWNFLPFCTDHQNHNKMLPPQYAKLFPAQKPSLPFDCHFLHF